MLELPLQEIEKFHPLVQSSGMRGHLALVYEIFEGRRNGQVFVDNQDDPQTAILCNTAGFFFAFGRPDNAMLDQLIWRFMQTGPDDNYTALFGSSSAWNTPLERAFAPYRVQCEKRLGFELRSMPAEPAVPPGFTLQPITESMAESILDGSGTGGFGVDPWFVRTAGGAAAYAALNLGLALVQKGQIASLCGVCGLGGGEAELEVGTIPAYRGRGLATIVSAAFMWQCQARGLQPAYSCSSDNAASISVAHHLGYVEIEEIQGYKLYEAWI